MDLGNSTHLHIKIFTGWNFTPKHDHWKINDFKLLKGYIKPLNMPFTELNFIQLLFIDGFRKIWINHSGMEKDQLIKFNIEKIAGKFKTGFT